MADNESDLEIDGLETALDTLCLRHCSKESSLNSKEYCSDFCELVEEYTGQWHVPLPQLKVLRTALCNFTKATAAFPDDCQHVQYVLSSLALSFFELMLFFSKEEFIEEPLKDILDTFQECHCKLLRHRNMYLQHVKQTIKGGGPWESPVLQGILKEADLPPNEVEDFLSSELPIFLELRVRYLQACERVQEVMALAKCCLENHETGKHLYFHQAYLTCLFKASLYENLQKEMAEIDGRDAVEIICNTESVEKDEFLLSLCRAFLTRQLHKGDMYYIWDLVFIWSRLYLRAHPSRQGFLAECLQLASSATNVRAIFPIIKLVTTELGAEGVQVCVELCCRALQLVDLQADAVTQSLVCKTIAFLLPHDLEICRACALLVFCQERSLEAYRTVCLLYRHPDEEQHPHSNTVRTSVRFPLLQMLKERLCFDPEFWNLFTLRTHCLELMSDNVMKDAELSEIKEEQEEEYNEGPIPNNCRNEPCTLDLKSCRLTQTTFVSKDLSEKQTDDGAGGKCIAPNNSSLKKGKWRKRLRKRTPPLSDEERELGDDPEFRYNLKSVSLGNTPMYSLRQNHSITEKPASKFPLNRKREYLSRCVKSQIFKRKGQRKRWLQGLPKIEQVQTIKVIRGKKRGRKPLHKLELSYPDNVVYLPEESTDAGAKTEVKEQEMPNEDIQCENKSEQKENELDRPGDTSVIGGSGQREHTQEVSRLCDGTLNDQRAAEANPELDGPLMELVDNPVEQFHCYCLQFGQDEHEQPQPPQPNASGVTNGDPEQKPEVPKTVEKAKTTWRERVLRTQQYRNCAYSCKFCDKTYKGMNVMRHAIAHLKMRKFKCIFCGKRFKVLNLAKNHVMEHIEEMCKQTPCEPSVKEAPPANGIMGKVENESQPQDENLISVSQKEPKRKSTVCSLSREERIIKNTRILFRKSFMPQKKGPNPETQVKKQVDFKDEQVVITNDLVMVKNVTLIQTKEEDKNVPAGENGQGLDLTYHLCPSKACDKVFLKISSSLTRHALKCHINEDQVLEKAFVWSKHKCVFCTRLTQFLQQYKEHMRLHSDPLPHLCYHLECKRRFSTQQELKDHIRTHDPLRLQCQYSNCDKLFSNFQTLYDHEWRHYIPVPLKEELDVEHGKAVQPSEEAPWKQRVKVEELWLQNKKGQRESPTPGIHIDGNEMEACGTQTTDLRTNVPEQDSSAETVSHEPLKDESTINGYEEIIPTSHVDDKSTPSKNCGKQPRTFCPINVKDGDEIYTLVEGVHKNIAEPHIIEHKTFKPEDPAYARFVKTPFVRPPPSTYLDESVLSMRKRRSADNAPPQKYVYNHFKKKKDSVTKKQQVVVDPEPKVRHRCDNCLTLFCTKVELQKHQALNTCSSLFGFDSDDES
uniref:Zinc finger protein 654 n=1 Tax=Nothobranchius pienaari TaxID=704102 RepID=A0A1A8L3T5_9TELE